MSLKACRRLGRVFWPCVILLLIYLFSPGLPVMFGPSASSKARAAGEAMFVRQWAPADAMAAGDGLGPVYNATSCAACHFQGGLGGAGARVGTVNTFEVLPNRRDGDLISGLVHRFSVEPKLREDDKRLHEAFPTVPGGVHLIGGCQVVVADFDPVRKEEINATSLFGAGWVDLISEKAIRHNASSRMWGEMGRNIRGDFEGVPVGRVRRLPDGRMGKFGWKAQFATLEEFVAAACANELGLSNPMFDQAAPLAARDHKAAGHDMTLKQVRQLSDFVATLPRPVQVMPEEPRDRRMAQRGEELFTSIGCAQCHTPTLCGVEGIYSDLLLHNVTDRRGGGGGYEEVPIAADPLPASHPQPDEWRTPPLWGVADSAPYFHDGGSATLHEAILRHGGQARHVKQAYENLSGDDRNAVLGFLKSLQAPPTAAPADPPTQAMLSGKKPVSVAAR